MKKILICETDRIGDVVLTLPVFKSIKAFNKNIHITALIRSYTEDIFNEFLYIDKIISFSDLDSRENRDKLLKTVKNEEFDTALALHPDRDIAKILKKAKIPLRYSYGWKWYQYLFSKVMIQHRSKNIKNQLDYNLDLLKLINIDKFNKNIRLKPSKDELKYIQNLLKSKKIDKKILIGVHPGSGHSSLNLPPEKYAELINTVKKKFSKTEIIITGTQHDQPAIEHILKNTNTALYPMPMNLTLASLIALIAKTKIFISNSTGPMHIASALRIPTIAFFSPVFIHSPIRWGPYWGERLIVKPDGDCPAKGKCKQKQCQLYNCFDNIEFKPILNFIKQFTK